MRRRPIAPAGLLVPRLLSDMGIAGVVAPVPGPTEALATPVPAPTLPLRALSVCPRRPRDGAGLTHAQWRTLGQTLRRIHDAAHTTALPAAIPREPFRPPWRDTVLQVDALLAADVWDAADPTVAAFAALWQARRDRDPRPGGAHGGIGRAQPGAADATGALSRRHPHRQRAGGRRRRSASSTGTGRCWRRADEIMFMVGGEVEPAPALTAAACVPRGLRPGHARPLALAYYRHEWVVQEVGDYGAPLAHARFGAGRPGTSPCRIRATLRPGRRGG
ncbi:MAG: hypothetical protein R2851_27325 [Caldilineaceae bacterium]